MSPKVPTRSFEIKWRYKPGTGMPDKVRTYYEIGSTRDAALTCFYVTHPKAKVDVLSCTLYKEYK